MTFSHILLFMAWITMCASLWQWLKAARRRHTNWLTLIGAIILALLFVGLDSWIVRKKANQELSNQELRDRTSRLVSEMRQYLAQKETEESARTDAYMRQIREATSEEERNRVSRNFNERGLSLNTEYSTRFKADAIILREELSSRLPNLRDKPLPKDFYNTPTNVIGLREIADELDLLSKRLPNTK